MQQQSRSLMVKNLGSPGLPERGKIKIGRKGKELKSKHGNKYQLPEKLDHFLITTLERGSDGNFVRDEGAHEIHGDQPKSIKVRLLFDEPTLNFQSRYVAFAGSTMTRSCDGEICEQRKQDGTFESLPCPCNALARDKRPCKLNGVLSVIVEGASTVGGVWKFRTTSFNTVKGIMSSLAFIQRITGGPMAGIPFNMTVNPRTVVSEPEGKIRKIYVVSLEFAGTIDELQEAGYAIALNNAKHGFRIDNIEAEAQKLLAGPTAEPSAEEAAEVVDEFYPDQAKKKAEATTDAKPSPLVDPTKQLIAAVGGEPPTATKPELEALDIPNFLRRTDDGKNVAALKDAQCVVVKEYVLLGDYLNALDKMLMEAENSAAANQAELVIIANESVLEGIAKANPKMADRIKSITEKYKPADSGSQHAKPADGSETAPDGTAGQESEPAVQPSESEAAAESATANSSGEPSPTTESPTASGSDVHASAEAGQPTVSHPDNDPSAGENPEPETATADSASKPVGAGPDQADLEKDLF